MNALFLQFLKEMQNKGRLKFYENHPLSLVSTFGIGGKARVFVLPCDKETLIDTVKMASESGRYAVIGNASNMLFDDYGFNGTVISTVKLKGISTIGCSKNELQRRLLSAASGRELFCALCGTSLPYLSSFALKNGLCGFEGLCSIPATVGGAICLNAGAYGTEISDNLVAYEVYLPHENAVYVKMADRCAFSHRKGPIARTGEIVLSAYFAAEKGDPCQIKARIEKNKALRAELQPLGVKSAGSYFKRPNENEGRGCYRGKSAGQIIDMCGLKGMTVGGAQVSKKHANFLINTDGKASARDVIRLARRIKTKVYMRTRIKLCEEVEFLGVNGKT